MFDESYLHKLGSQLDTSLGVYNGGAGVVLEVSRHNVILSVPARHSHQSTLRP